MKYEIKFRWVGLNKKFGNIQINSGLTTTKLLDGNVLSFFSQSNRGADGNCEFLSEDLFTGLTDKNGVEIYEGDILWRYESKGAEIKTFCQITYEEARFIPKWITTTWFNNILRNHVEELEIIGNIYENPELLK